MATDVGKPDVSEQGSPDPGELLERTLTCISNHLRQIECGNGLESEDQTKARILSDYARTLVASHKPIADNRPGADEEELIRDLLEGLPREVLEGAIAAKSQGKRGKGR